MNHGAVFIRLALVFALALGLIGAASPATQPDRAGEIAKAIGELGDADYGVREKATRLLWSIGRSAEPALREAARAEDAEIAWRAQSILQKFNLGIYPDSPKELVEALEKYGAGGPEAKQEALVQLLQMNPVPLASITALYRNEKDPAFQQDLRRVVMAESNRLIPKWVAGGKLDDAVQTLEVVAASGDVNCIRNLAALLLSLDRLKPAIAKLEAQPRLTNIERLELVYLHRAAGDLKAALARAQQAGDEALVRDLRAEMGDWKELAKTPPAATENTLIANGEAAMLNRLAGNEKEADGAIAALKSEAKRVNANAVKVDEKVNIAPILLLNDRFQEAVEAAVEAGEHTHAFETLADLGRYDDAVALVDGAKDNPLMHAQLKLLLAQLRQRLGDDKKAQELIAEVSKALESDALQRLTAQGDPTPDRLRYEVIEAELSLGMVDSALDHADKVRLGGPSEEEGNSTMGSAFCPGAFDHSLVWAMFRENHQGDSPREMYKRIWEIYNPEADSATVRKWCEVMMQKAKDRPPQWTIEISRVYNLHDINPESIEVLRKLMKRPDHGLDPGRMGKLLVLLGYMDDAIPLLKQQMEAHPEDAESQQALGLAMMAGGGESAVQGRKLIDIAGMMPLGNTLTSVRMAAYLHQMLMDEPADRMIDRAARVAWLSSRVTPIPREQAVARITSPRPDPTAAWTFQERRRLMYLSRVPASPRLCISISNDAFGARQVAAIARGEIDAAIGRTLARLEQAPVEVEPVIVIVAALDAAKRKDAADQVFAKAWNNYTKLVKEYPNSPLLLNNGAWLAARCRRQSDDAVAWSQKAVSLTPRQHGNRDTYAEALFQAGKKDQAIVEMKKCLEQQPDEAYYKRQLKRFEAGDTSIDPQHFNE